MGAFLSSINAGRAPPSQIIDVMSIYHPFPLRLDSLNKGAPVQYDACLQLGEFPSDRYKGNSAVVLFPLKVKRDPDSKGKFMDDIASKIPAILGQQPDPITGYPDVPAHTGANWSIEDILFMKNKAGDTVSRAFYAWINKTPFPVGVVVMAEPVFISQANMDAIKRLPITPPSDVIHEIGTPILYKPGPIFDEEGNPQPCPATASEIAQKTMNSIIQPPVPTKEGGFDLDLFFQVVLGALGTLVVILGVWFGIKLAMGPGKTFMTSIGDSLGRSLAGGYDALKKVNLPTVPTIPKIPESVKKTRRNIGNRLGFGSEGKFGTKRQTQRDTPLANVFPNIKSSRDLKTINNPLFNSKKGSINDIANLPAANIPEPKPGTINSITNLPPANIPKPIRDSRLKRNQGQRALPIVNSAMQELNDLEDSINREKRQTKDNLLKKASVVNAFKSRDKTPRNRLSDIARQQSSKKVIQSSQDTGSTKKVDQPIQDPGAGTGLLPQTAPVVTPRRRRRIIQEEEDDEEEVKKDSRDDEYDPTKLFGSKFLRKSHGFNYGGKRRQKRKKTGRKI
jgi:hypothetical protein